MDSVPVDSVLVIPWPFRNPPEFCGTEITILAGSTAKIPFRGIPGINRIPADSGRNTWRTVKNSSPGAPKHPRWVYNILFHPKYKISHPQFPPNEPNSERTTRPLLLALFTSIYQCPQPSPNSPALLYTPPSHPAPSAYQLIHPLTQRTLLLILTNPGTTAKSFFLGGGVYPVWIYEVTWGIPGFSCMRVATTGVILSIPLTSPRTNASPLAGMCAYLGGYRDFGSAGINQKIRRSTTINAIPAEEEGGSTRGQEQFVLARRRIWGGRNTRGEGGL
jgi:hypothetical protein